MNCALTSKKLRDIQAKTEDILEYNLDILNIVKNIQKIEKKGAADLNDNTGVNESKSSLSDRSSNSNIDSSLQL